jgi:hypothetical protein
VFHTARAKSSASQQKDRRSITAVFFCFGERHAFALDGALRGRRGH